MKLRWIQAGLGMMAVQLATFSAQADELNIMIPRVPASQIAMAKTMKPPFSVTPEVIAKGKKLYDGAGTCFPCHGTDGKGKVDEAMGLNPSPPDLSSYTFDQIRTAGEMMWVVSNGSPLQPAMVGFVSLGQITESQAWEAVFYVRSFGCKGDMDCIVGSLDWVARQGIQQKVSSLGEEQP